VASARVAYLARRAREFGVITSEDSGDPITMDMTVAIARKREVVRVWRTGSEKSLEETHNLTLIRGEASFTGAHDISVAFPDGSVRELAAKKIFINTGTRTAVPEIAGLGEVPFLNNESIMELETLPKHLVVLGGGYIALEFAQMFRRFGSAVTTVQKGPALPNTKTPMFPKRSLRSSARMGLKSCCSQKRFGCVVRADQSC